MAKVHDNDRILLIDHQPIYREGLRTALLQAGYPIVGEAGTSHQGLRVAEEQTPGIAIIEARLPGINGFVTAAFMRRSAPWTKVVMIAHQLTPALTASAIRVGAIRPGSSLVMGSVSGVTVTTLTPTGKLGGAPPA